MPLKPAHCTFTCSASIQPQKYHLLQNAHERTPPPQPGCSENVNKPNRKCLKNNLPPLASGQTPFAPDNQA